jgi:hypothetical protein
MPRSFKSPDKNYVIGKFSTSKRPKTPSPKKKDYSKRAQTKADAKSRCTYIHPQTGKRCKNHLGLYPEYCELHTMMIHNVYIAPSQIAQAGNGLYAGPYGFKKGDIIGEYSFPWNEVSLGNLSKRCRNEKCWSYVFCDEGEHDNTKCWDGLDIRSTLMRNINDAHKSGFKNNAYFDVIKGHVYAIASRNIKPQKECLISYGRSYWANKEK